LAIWVALVVLAVTPAAAAGAPPQPDAAPQAPAVAPDPVPGTAPAQEPTQPAEQPPPPAQSQPPAAAPTPRSSTPQPREPATKPAREHHRASTQPRREDGEVDTARAASMLRIKALLPGDQTSADSSSGLLLLAAGALLALVLASGSMVSVASRAMKGQLR
jgi:type IV secretory pathway VirB10-like protein